MAKVCKAFGMTVWIANTTGRTTEDYVDQARTLKDLNEILMNCDYLCNLLPETEDTIDISSVVRL